MSEKKSEKTNGNIRHGLSRTPTHNAWLAMKRRCLYKNDVRYSRYGGRGIKVCRRWMHFDNFLEDMGVKPNGYQLDRIDNDGDYSPANCRWIPASDQAKNRSTTINLTFNGKTQPINDWANELGIKRQTLQWRYHKGWSVQRILTTEVR